LQGGTSSGFSDALTYIFPADTTEGYVSGLTEKTIYWFRVYERKGTVRSEYSNVVSLSTWTVYFEKASQVSSGGKHTCAIREDSSLWCWGNNEYGQLGLEYFGSATNTPQFVTSGVSLVSLGWNHTCAVKVDGSLWCWGYNEYGQLWLGDNVTMTTLPQMVTGIIDVVSVLLSYFQIFSSFLYFLFYFHFYFHFCFLSFPFTFFLFYFFLPVFILFYSILFKVFSLYIWEGIE